MNTMNEHNVSIRHSDRVNDHIDFYSNFNMPESKNYDNTIFH